MYCHADGGSILQGLIGAGWDRTALALPSWSVPLPIWSRWQDQAKDRPTAPSSWSFPPRDGLRMAWDRIAGPGTLARSVHENHR